MNPILSQLGESLGIHPKVWEGYVASHAIITSERMELAQLALNQPSHPKVTAFLEKAKDNPNEKAQEEEDDYGSPRAAIITEEGKTYATIEMTGPFVSGIMALIARIFGLSAITVENTQAQLNFIQRAITQDETTISEVRMMVNSPGGEVRVLSDVVNRITDTVRINSIGSIGAVVRGWAASAGVDLCLIVRGDGEIKVEQLAKVIFHAPISTASGYAFDLRQVADALEETQKMRSRSYARRMNFTAQEFIDMMEANRGLIIYSADQSLEIGFADMVIDMNGEESNPEGEVEDTGPAEGEDDDSETASIEDSKASEKGDPANISNSDDNAEGGGKPSGGKTVKTETDVTADQDSEGRPAELSHNSKLLTALLG